MKLTKNLPTKHFVVSQILILLFCLIFLGGLYYILNIQYQKSQSLFSNGPVTTLPKSLRLELNQPDDHSLTFQPSVVISGQTTPLINILISTTADDLVIKSNLDGSFSTVLSLKEGVNKITAAVFDTTGDFRSVQRTIYYSKEKI